jgi:hypothetical protein
MIIRDIWMVSSRYLADREIRDHNGSLCRALAAVNGNPFPHSPEQDFRCPGQNRDPEQLDAEDFREIPQARIFEQQSGRVPVVHERAEIRDALHPDGHENDGHDIASEYHIEFAVHPGKSLHVLEIESDGSDEYEAAHSEIRSEKDQHEGAQQSRREFRGFADDQDSDDAPDAQEISQGDQELRKVLDVFEPEIRYRQEELHADFPGSQVALDFADQPPWPSYRDGLGKNERPGDHFERVPPEYLIFRPEMDVQVLVQQEDEQNPEYEDHVRPDDIAQIGVGVPVREEQEP